MVFQKVLLFHHCSLYAIHHSCLLLLESCCVAMQSCWAVILVLPLDCHFLHDDGDDDDDDDE